MRVCVGIAERGINAECSAIYVVFVLVDCCFCAERSFDKLHFRAPNRNKMDTRKRRLRVFIKRANPVYGEIRVAERLDDFVKAFGRVDFGGNNFRAAAPEAPKRLYNTDIGVFGGIERYAFVKFVNFFIKTNFFHINRSSIFKI